MTPSPACWLPRTAISSATLRSVIEYGLPFIGLTVSAVCALWRTLCWLVYCIWGLHHHIATTATLVNQGCQVCVKIPTQLPPKTNPKVAQFTELAEFTANFGSETQQLSRWRLNLAEHQCTKCFDGTKVAPKIDWIEAVTGGWHAKFSRRTRSETCPELATMSSTSFCLDEYWWLHQTRSTCWRPLQNIYVYE